VREASTQGEGRPAVQDVSCRDSSEAGHGVMLLRYVDANSQYLDFSVLGHWLLKCEWQLRRFEIPSTSWMEASSQSRQVVEFLEASSFDVARVQTSCSEIIHVTGHYYAPAPVW
jgi:hypothetical protein